jgi:hypothetical protein
MNITIGGRDVHDHTDAELIDWMNETKSGYHLREGTAQLWVAVMRAINEAGPPVTVRQIYYALVSRGAIPKTENAYDRVVYHVLKMRRGGVLPYDFIADNTRWMRKPQSYVGIEAYLEAGQQAYRRALWANQEAYVEIWCEKEALAGVINGITSKWDVPLMVTRGYPSETFVYEAAETLKCKRKPVFLYYFGDYDPSGRDIPVSTKAKLKAFGAQFVFEVVAVKQWQIDAWDLPLRPTKRSDVRARNWVGGSVELDAVPVPTLRRLVEEIITRHIDQQALEATLETERLERQALGRMMDNVGLAPHSGAGEDDE